VIDNTDLSLRAFSPNPSLRIETTGVSPLRISVNNISPKAEMQVHNGAPEQIKETVDGINRVLEIQLSSTTPSELSWQLPKLGDYKFASIGDTGGALELDWCIKRAHALGAEFLLHLGDFSYQKGDYQNAIQLFNHAPLPCYVSIGNHDFKDIGGEYPLFLKDIGPFNHQFAIGSTRFANIDSSAFTIPYGGGHRGRLMDQLIEGREQFTSTVAFTHRPLYDPDPLLGNKHHFGSNGERNWLINALKQAKVETLLSGHLHIQSQRDIEGINNIIAGQGLGHQDLITNSDYSKMAIGNVDSRGQVEFDFAPLSMPMNIHCHPRSDYVKQELVDSKHALAIEQIDLACRNNR
jgi:3',5'-cyclic AMP phosphodiesterase CpdA